jgi:hypothetical protein
MADDYETCMHELARELAINAEGLAEEQCIILIRPVNRRKKKQMSLKNQ